MSSAEEEGSEEFEAENEQEEGQEANKHGFGREVILAEGELAILSEEEFEEERRQEKLALMERLRRVRAPHMRRKMVLAEPCIPWEYGSNKHDSQKGTGGFGRIRNTTLKTHASREFTRGDPAAVPRWSQISGFASQAGQTPFGAIREQVTRVVEHEGEGKKACQELLVDPRESERILKLWALPNPEAKNQKLFGCKRQVVEKSVGGRQWTSEELAKSRAAVPRLCRVEETSAARDGREALNAMATGFVSQRQATMQVKGLERTAQDQLETNKCQSWLGGQLLLQTQSKTGGFQKSRDVVNTSYYARLMSESGILKGDGPKKRDLGRLEGKEK